MIVKYLDETANVQLKRRQNFADDDIGSDKPTASRRFTRVLDHLNFEYDLSDDVLAEAEALLQAIEGEAKEMNAFHMDRPAPISVEITSPSRESLLTSAVVSRPARGQ